MVMPAAEAGLQRGTLVMPSSEISLPAMAGFSRHKFTRPGRRVCRWTDSPRRGDRGGLETFFHKIAIIRNNLRVPEQKVNASDKLSDADKFDLQQYITRCYGSLTTFNILFKNKDDQFRTSAQGSAMGRPVPE